MGTEEFENAAGEVRQLERKLLAYAPYGGDVHIAQTLELEPREYVDLAYSDMLNLYERSEKIRGTVGMAVFKAAGTQAAGPPAPKPTAASAEIETRLKQMTTETLKKAEEVAKEPTPEKAAQPKPGPEQAERQQTPYEMEIEFEHHTVERKQEEHGIEFERIERKAPENEAQAPRPMEAIEPAIEMPAEKKMVVATIPPALRESPDEAAGRRYELMEEQVRAMLGGAVDEISIKKKMLDLTKELFKEKSTNRREQIKLQISVMKNMLVGGPAAGKRKKAAGDEEETHGRLLETIISTQQAELAQTKDTITNSYNKQMDAIKKKFHEDIANVETPAKRKVIFESFVFSVTSLVEQLPQVLKKYQDYTVKKHAAEIEKVRETLGEKEDATGAMAQERLEYIRKGYDAEFAPVKGIIGRQIESLIDSTGSGVFEKEETAGGDREAKMLEMVGEINATDEGTLLYYLHSKDAEFYGKYERKQTSKAEAIARAKALLAREKGLNDSMRRKYFSGTED